MRVLNLWSLNSLGALGRQCSTIIRTNDQGRKSPREVRGAEARWVGSFQGAPVGKRQPARINEISVAPSSMRHFEFLKRVCINQFSHFFLLKDNCEQITGQLESVTMDFTRARSRQSSRQPSRKAILSLFIDEGGQACW